MRQIDVLSWRKDNSFVPQDITVSIIQDSSLPLRKLEDFREDDDLLSEVDCSDKKRRDCFLSRRANEILCACPCVKQIVSYVVMMEDGRKCCYH